MKESPDPLASALPGGYSLSMIRSYGVVSVLAISLLLGACGGDDDVERWAPGPGATGLMDGAVRLPLPAIDGGGAAGGDAGLVDVNTARAIGDCSRANEECFEVRGAYQGRPFACPGTPFFSDAHKGNDGVTRFSLLLIGCSDVVFQVAMQIPVGTVGPFDYAESLGRPRTTSARVEAARGADGKDTVKSDQPTFTGRARGLVTPERTVRGSYTARWSNAACSTVAPNGDCGETWFTMTFNARIPNDLLRGEIEI